MFHIFLTEHNMSWEVCLCDVVGDCRPVLSQPQEATTSDIQWPRHKVGEIQPRVKPLISPGIEHTAPLRSVQANKMMPIKKTLVSLSSQLADVVLETSYETPSSWSVPCRGAGLPGHG